MLLCPVIERDSFTQADPAILSHARAGLILHMEGEILGKSLGSWELTPVCSVDTKMQVSTNHWLQPSLHGFDTGVDSQEPKLFPKISQGMEYRPACWLLAVRGPVFYPIWAGACPKKSLMWKLEREQRLSSYANFVIPIVCVFDRNSRRCEFTRVKKFFVFMGSWKRERRQNGARKVMNEIIVQLLKKCPR